MLQLQHNNFTPVRHHFTDTLGEASAGVTSGPLFKGQPLTTPKNGPTPKNGRRSGMQTSPLSSSSPVQARPETGLRYHVRRSRLEGRVRVSGAKNSVLRLMAASLLSAQPVILRNYPAQLRDAEIHRQMLERLGKTCTISHSDAGDVLTIEESSAPASTLLWEGRSIRNTLLILGALCARTGAGQVPMPGGCNLGNRKYDIHVDVLQALGARVIESEAALEAQAPDGLIGGDIHLRIRSTGATENALICASLARGTSTIWNPHIRPEIIDLVNLLRQMGAEITVYGQERITVTGTEALGGADHRILPDNMEALTWMIGATLTGGDIEIEDFPTRDLEVPLAFLRESGVRYFQGSGAASSTVIVQGGTCWPIEIATGPYPGINSDMQPLFAIFGAMSRGESRIVDLRFPGRYAYADEFNRMGLACEVQGDALHIGGGRMPVGTDVTALDLRAGIALTLAGLVAEGETIVHDAWQVERGYDRFVEKLTSLGGQIETQGP